MTEDQKTLRDEFAMADLTGMVLPSYPASSDMISYADAAYKIADAMMEARKK